MPAAKAHVLVVDDDLDVLTFLLSALGADGYEVEASTTSAGALRAISRRAPDLVVLDVMLGGEDGLDLLSEIRSDHAIPVVLLTGRGGEGDRVLGLRMGADDYVVKPFSAAELSARIHSILRRSGQAASQAPRTLRTFGWLAIDTVAREVSVRGMVVDTTAKEFDLLLHLSGSPRQVFSRQQLLEAVWDSSSDWQDPATVTEHVRRLRLKIEDEPDRPAFIRTVRGVGYRFEP